MPRFVSVLLVVIAFGSVTGLAWMLGRPTPPDPRVATLEADLRSSQKELARLRDQLAQRPASPAVAASGSADTASAPGASVPAGTGTAPATPGTSKNLRDVLATPGMKAVLEQQQAMQVDVGYGRLFDTLQLNPEEKANFRRLLVEREKALTDITLKLMDPNLTQDQRKQLALDLQNQKAGYDETFKTFLNDANDFSTFKQWEGTQPERVQFDMLGRTLFAQSGEPLSAEQEQQLINTAAQVRKAPASASEFSNPVNLDPAKMTEASIQNYIQQLKKNDDQVVAQAASFLSPAQLKTLQAYQEQARNMALTSMKMSAALGAPGK